MEEERNVADHSIGRFLRKLYHKTLLDVPNHHEFILKSFSLVRNLYKQVAVF